MDAAFIPPGGKDFSYKDTWLRTTSTNTGWGLEDRGLSPGCTTNQLGDPGHIFLLFEPWFPERGDWTEEVLRSLFVLPR